jgi:hypothetical protein
MLVNEHGVSEQTHYKNKEPVVKFGLRNKYRYLYIQDFINRTGFFVIRN